MRHDLKIDWDEYQAPKITVEPKASVHIEIAREPVLEITVIEETIPPKREERLIRRHRTYWNAT